MHRTTLSLCFAALILGAPGLAGAQPRAFMIDGADIYAGPGNDFPVVARLAPGVRVNVQGCLDDYTWCDVTFGGNRGWVYAGELGYPYQSSRVPIVQYGPRLGLPVITFSLGNYWDRYYRGRPWYRERNDWDRRWHGHDEHRGRDWRDDRRVEHDRRDDRRDYRSDERRDYRSDDRRDNRSSEARQSPRPSGPPPRPGSNEASRMTPDSPGYYGSQQ